MTATGDADRVSTLPEELLGHILSFLDMKHSVQTCILSKSWRFGWRSVTSLNFDMNLWKQFFDFSLWPYPEYLRQSKGSIQLFCNGENSCGFNDEKLMSFEESKRFIRFVDRALYLSSALHIFSFNGLYSDSIAPYQVNKWITSAVSQHVEELHLKRINLLPSLSLGQVKTLKLSEVDLLHNDKELLFHLPVVENLILHDCTCSRSENLVICAPQVKYLSMETIAGVPAIKISAPNLISLKLKGELHAVSFLENFSSLVTAKLEADLRQSDCIIKQIEKLQHLKEILKGISLSNAKSLIVSTQCFPKKFWPEMVPDIWKQFEYEVKFHNVKYLKLTNWDKKTKGDIGAVVKLLESFSKLETIAFDKTLTKEQMEKRLQQKALLVANETKRQSQRNNRFRELLCYILVESSIYPEKMATTRDADRISTLPEELLGHILSFLDMKHSVQTCILSKSWRFGWRSVTSLNFDISLWQCPRADGEYVWSLSYQQRCSEKNILFIKFVDKAIDLCSGNKFSFNSYCPGFYSFTFVPDQVNKWITSAVVSQHVQELHLKGITLLPTLLLGQVKTLKLLEVGMVHGDKEVLFDLPVVENLVLHHCSSFLTEILVISAPQVKYLSMKNIAVPAIKIRAPNLISLKLKQELSRAVSFLDNLSSLVTAELDVGLSQSDYLVIMIEKVQHVKEILQGISLSNAKSLTLSTHCFPQKFWPEMVLDIWNQNEVNFGNVKYLKLSKWGRETEGVIGAAAKLLESFPNLETLAFDKTLTEEVMNNLDLFFVFLPKIWPELEMELFNQDPCKTHNVKYLKFSNLHMRMKCDISGVAKLLKSFHYLGILSSDRTWTKKQMELLTKDGCSPVRSKWQKKCLQKALLVADMTKGQPRKNNRSPLDADVRRQHNLSATAKVQAYVPNSQLNSFDPVNMRGTGDADRISTLPEELLGHILSFLDMKYVVKTCIFSKSWRHRWRFVTSLNFDFYLWQGPFLYLSDEKARRFVKFVDEVFCLHEAYGIKKFSLRDWVYFNNHSFSQSNKWIKYALSRHVQELHLQEIQLELTSLVGQVKTLKLLKVHFCKYINHMDKEFLLDLPVVENFVLQDCSCNDTLTINAPRMKYFSVKFTRNAVIKICAPYLISLKLEGEVRVVSFVDNFSSLVTAEIITDSVQCQDKITIRIKEVVSLQKILKRISVCNAESLTLSTRYFQIWPELMESCWNLDPIEFHNVKCLKLTDWQTELKGDISTIAMLLESFRNLETLAFDKTWTKEQVKLLSEGRSTTVLSKS
ncbi:hypothetical protein IFM89_007535 [Coptis chinensis]|uniref:F-box domain-containing protein n=1 Tax=Coptis chinensis TaxID=261450 RepID=A0A835I0A2_9MAGN|nr:hypothetical protein IFM89_007535 [Coptis chinensis]